MQLSPEAILRNFGGRTSMDLNSFIGSSDDTSEGLPKFENSGYYDIDTLTACLRTNSSKFSLLSLNIQSLSAKFDQLKILLFSLIDNDVKVNAI